MSSFGDNGFRQFQLLPEVMRTLSVPGQIYMIEIGTDGVPNPKETYGLLKTRLSEEFGIETKGMEVRDGVIRLQFFAGLPFSWAALIEFLPLILKVIGIIVTVITAFVIVSRIETWQIALLGLGIILTLFGDIIPKLLGGERK